MAIVGVHHFQTDPWGTKHEELNLWCPGSWRSRSFHVHIDLSTYRSIYLLIDLSIYLSIYLSISLSIYRSIYLSIYPSIQPSIFPSIYLSVCLSVYLSIYLLHIYIRLHMYVLYYTWLHLYIHIYIYIIIYIYTQNLGRLIQHGPTIDEQCPQSRSRNTGCFHEATVVAGLGGAIDGPMCNGERSGKFDLVLVVHCL